MKFIITSFHFLSLLPLFFGGCGSHQNVFQPLAPGEGKDGARSAFSRGDYDTAIKELEAHLKKFPGDSEALSMLASARMKKAGLDQLEIAAKIADLQASQGKGELQSILTAMPSGTANNVDQLRQAVNTLSQISPENRTPDQNFQLGLAQAALAITLTKLTVGDPSGTSIDENKVNSLGDADAALILENITQASENISLSSTSTPGASSIGSLGSKINGAAGDTPSEKLRNFLKNS